MFVQLNPLNYTIVNATPLRITSLSDTHEHIPFLMMLIDIIRPEHIVELGTTSGETYCAMCQAVSHLSLKTDCTSFLKYSKSDRTHDELDIYADLRAHHDKLYSVFSSVQFADSEINQHCQDKSIDILSLHGIGSAAELEKITAEWMPKMSRRGVILVFRSGELELDSSCSDTESIFNLNPKFEFTHQNGMLILMIGSELPEPIKELSVLSKSDISAVRQYFTGLGTSFSVLIQLRKLHNLERVLDSGSWKLMKALQKLRAKFIPHGSSKENLYYFIWQLSAALIKKGPLGVHRIYKERMLVRKEFFEIQQSYANWISVNTPNSIELGRPVNESAKLPLQPLISLLIIDSVSSVNTPKLIKSVIAQTYSNWELLISDTGRELIPSDDARIKRVTMPEGLQRAGEYSILRNQMSGEYACLLYDCILAPNYLYDIVHTLPSDASPDIIFTDEDKISSETEIRSDPWFKPSLLSPELLLSINYLRTSLIRQDLLIQIGDIIPDDAEALERELIFRIIELTNKTCHVPSVLVHRISPKAPRDEEANLRCIESHLIRKGIQEAKAHYSRPEIVRVTWPVSGNKVSIIIPTKNKAAVLKTCLTTMLKTTEYPDYEVILIDNGSSEPETLQYYQQLRTNPKIKIVDYNQPFNWSAANNLGARHATGDFFLFLNNDVEILTADWLEEMVRWAELDDTGVVGAKLLFPGGTIQHANVTLGLGFAGHYFSDAADDHMGMYGSVDWYRDYMAVTGACMMMRRGVYAEVCGFDEDYILAFSDVLICVQLWRKGYRTIYTPFARLTHHEGKTRAKYTPSSDIKLAYADMHEFIDNGDPYFNPNLSSLHSMPNFADPDAVIGEEFARNVLARYAIKPPS